MRHPHTVTFFVASPSAIVMERMAGGSLSTKIRTLTAVSEHQRLTWCLHIVAGIRYIHTYNVIHGDIAADNIMFTSDDIAKIGDFGAAYFGTITNESERITTDRYLPLTLQSPSADIQSAIGFDTDRYALVCVLLNLLGWNIDIYDICGISFFERTLMSCTDRDAYITQCLALACPKVWDLLWSVQPLGCRTRCILFQFFTMPCMEMMDEKTTFFVRDHVGTVDIWTHEWQAMEELQRLLTEDIRKSCALVAAHTNGRGSVERPMAASERSTDTPEPNECAAAGDGNPGGREKTSGEREV